MIVSISLLDGHEHYTNLDVVHGQVIFRVPNPATVSSIIAKLEGESRTRLMAAVNTGRPQHPGRSERQKPALEVHKFLYKTRVLFPTNIRLEELAQNPKASFPIDAGQHTFPFEFKIPLNTSCQPISSPIPNISFSNSLPEVIKPSTDHIKSTLPPSLAGFPGEAEIRYFVKVTVNRPQFYKENPRAMANFTFLPIEPPRPKQADGEAYARRQHQFLDESKKAEKSAPSIPPGLITPRVVLDARLPNPAILTCNQDVPLRLLLKNVSERTKNLYLQMLQIELIGYTKVRAHEVSRTESSSWILCSFSSMAIPIGASTDPLDTEVAINPEYWSGRAIPNMIPPTFTTCNLQRFYELEVRVGLGYGSYVHGEDQLVVLPLRLPVKVYSGIAPPTALLSGVSTAAPADLKTSGLNVPAQQQVPHTSMKPTPGGPGASSSWSQGQSAQAQHGSAPEYEDAPPSYEEAIGEDLPPIHGYRGSYQPPPGTSGTSGLTEGGTNSLRR